MSTETTELIDQARSWIAQDPDITTQAELSALVEAAEAHDESALSELRSRFSGHLTFGTAGLRAEIGAGPARMNRVVVSHAAHGLGQFLTEKHSPRPPSVVIGFDARHNSDVFAKDTAEILKAMGLRVVLFDQVTPTPVLAFAVRHLDVDAGVMVTASHNPPADNGYKVYLGGADEGSQIVPPADSEIHRAIMASHETVSASTLPRSHDYDTAGQDVIEAYQSATLALSQTFTDEGRASLKICYTPMHGVGGDVFLSLMTNAGFSALHPVGEQFTPDPDFPTVSFPNPEEPGALDLAFAKASAVGADLIIAHDPDADRLAVALPLPDSAGWQMLSGNELGATLASAKAKDAVAQGKDGVIGFSMVSSPIAATIAKQHSLTPQDTPTGFKWISRIPGLIFGYEEALGYLVNPETVRDKDGISAGLYLACLAANLHWEGRTLWDALEDVRSEYGGFASDQISLRFDTMAVASLVMDEVRNAPDQVFSSLAIESVDDLLTAKRTGAQANLIVFQLSGGSRIIVRPSGTEPKLKVYLDTLRPDQETADRELEELRVSVSTAVEQLLQRSTRS
ncbi:phosphoglucomutase [Pontimonas salivibrio]|uniref:Phosphoglucomutase n=1 Tax=Pontimonas salivibrio TaxID=1159327 RepID=A0A2L2BSI4_9MICO|nr:phospho-sugar mutase [Pontimonas salivibrio]AVG24597.1 phosphoglucomutase [Pontimonas salivibrio]